MLRATTACTFSTSQLPKVVREWCVLYILTWKCASRHNGVHFFDISTSKSGPNLVCFVHFDFKMCFAPQRRALFRHLNFQKWSENGVFCAFWLPNVLRATTACTFSSLIWPAGSAPAALANLLSEPTFRPSGAPNHWKNTVFRDFPTFSHICIFFLLTLSLLIFFLLIFLFSLPLPCSAFHLSILSEVWLLNFLRLTSHVSFYVSERRVGRFSLTACIEKYLISPQTSPNYIEKTCGRSIVFHILWLINIYKYGLSPMALSGPDRQYLGLRHPGPSPGVSMANSQSLINSGVFDETHIFLGELIQLPSGKHTKNELENHHD